MRGFWCGFCWVSNGGVMVVLWWWCCGGWVWVCLVFMRIFMWVFVIAMGFFLCGFCWVSYGGVIVVPWGSMVVGFGFIQFSYGVFYVGFVIVMGFLMWVLLGFWWSYYGGVVHGCVVDLMYMVTWWWLYISIPVHAKRREKKNKYLNEVRNKLSLICVHKIYK